MALLQAPKFNASSYYDFNIDLPGSGGINLKDLEFELDANQSPYMLNMFYRNGHLCKRYGQEKWLGLSIENGAGTANDSTQVLGIGYYDNNVYIATEGFIWECKLDTREVNTSYEDSTISGECKFINFNRKLYCWNSSRMYEFDPTVERDSKWKLIEPYIPNVVINRKPDGSYHDLADNYNRIGAGFKNTFNGDGSATVYKLNVQNLDNVKPIVEVLNGTVPDYTFDAAKGTVTFSSAPVKGNNNVLITAYKTNDEYLNTVINCKYFKPYGGNSNSRLFAAGGGDGIIYYSDLLDISYFPDNNSFQVGSDEDDVTGFGEQYDTLMVFKPREIYSLEYYLDSNNIGAFQMKLVNGEIGCDAPNTIQLINNQLVWLSTVVGVCTLVSTNIEDERNIRIISRNIEGGYHYNGLMQEANLDKALSVDFDNKYMIYVNSKMYVWDYLMTPYANTGKLDKDAKRLAWFIFDNFDIEYFIKSSHYLYFAKGSQIVKLSEGLNDFGKPINAYYKTPYLQFGAVAYLKTVKNIYIQTLADEAVQIDMTYFTEDTPEGEKESEPIKIYGGLWNKFAWNTFGWQVTNLANTFRRKCSLKKIQMCSVLFENNEADKDMSISHIGFQYMIVKNIK